MSRFSGGVALTTTVAALALLVSVSPAGGADKKVYTGQAAEKIETLGGAERERGATESHCVTIVWLTLVLGVSTSKCELDGALGYAALESPVGPPRILIARSYLPRRWRADQATAVAVFILAHELGHVRRGIAESSANEFVRSRWCGIVGLLRRAQPRLPDCHVLLRLVPPSFPV